MPLPIRPPLDGRLTLTEEEVERISRQLFSVTIPKKCFCMYSKASQAFVPQYEAEHPSGLCIVMPCPPSTNLGMCVSPYLNRDLLQILGKDVCRKIWKLEQTKVLRCADEFADSFTYACSQIPDLKQSTKTEVVGDLEAFYKAADELDAIYRDALIALIEFKAELAKKEFL